MRVSTSWIYSSGAATLSQKQAELARTQQKISAGTSVLVPSDDPVAAARALGTQQSLAVTAQYASNQTAAQSALGLSESTLGQIGTALQNIRTLAVQAGNGTLSASDRQTLAVDLRNQTDALMGLANTRDGTGGYIFAGYQDSTQPFVRGTSGVVYQGDQGSRALQVSAQRTMDVAVSGASVFEGAHAGNGSFTVAVAATNTGSGSADAGQVIDPTALTGHGYQVQFHGAPGAITYDVIDTTTSASVISGASYTAGMAIGFDGLQFSMNGTPANNDSVSIAPSARKSVFDTLDSLTATLQARAAGTIGDAEYQTRLNSSLASIDQAYDQVLSARTGAGARLNELDALSSQNASQQLNYQDELSKLTGLDYTQAVSDLSQQQTSLQAAQQSYVHITGLSLFNYL